MHLPRSSLRRAATALAAVAATLAGGLAAPAANAAPRHHAIVDPGLTAAVEAGQEATFFVVLDSHADLSDALRQRGKARKAAVFQARRAEAARDQSSLTRYLDQAKIGYESYWIANAVKVTGDRDLVEQLAARPDVAALKQEQRYAIDTAAMGPVTATEAADPGLGRQGHPGRPGLVSSSASAARASSSPTSTPACSSTTRRWSASTAATWATAPSTTTTTGSTRPSVCPAAAPCDNNGHGTHTMGTMVGDDGAGNQIGVAPGARWIAAKGCETSCLLRRRAAGRRPVDAGADRPRRRTTRGPTCAPHIVNNSWGGGGNDPWYQDIVDAWVAAGHLPGVLQRQRRARLRHRRLARRLRASYGVGAFDVNNAIASFSSRGPSRVDGAIKPNIAAPGVNVRSSVPAAATARSQRHLDGRAARRRRRWR